MKPPRRRPRSRVRDSMSVGTFLFDGACNARSEPRTDQAVGLPPGAPHETARYPVDARRRYGPSNCSDCEWTTVDRLTGQAASPGFVVLLWLALVSWIGLNTILLLTGRRPLDEPPFFWMQGALSLAALYMTVLILATQRREKNWRAMTKSHAGVGDSQRTKDGKDHLTTGGATPGSSGYPRSD
jgi:hypothetical protein